MTWNRRATGILLCACLASLAALSGCGDDEQSGGSDKATAPKSSQGTTYDASTKPRNATIEIALKNTALTPQFVKAREGQTIVWKNEDDARHRLEATEGADFAPKTLTKGQTLKYRIPSGATGQRWFQYVCTIHPAKMGGYTEIVR